MPWESLNGRSVGIRYGSGKEAYCPDADLLFMPFNVSEKRLGPTSIVHFYVWDTEFGGLDTDEGMRRLLAKLVGRGVRYVVQTDLSAWYHLPVDERKAIVRRNFRNLELTLEAGCVPILNWNAIFEDDFDYYRSILPRDCYTLAYDFQHTGASWKRGDKFSEGKYIAREARAVNLLLKYFHFDRMLLVAARSRLSKAEEEFIFLPFQRAGVQISFVPNETAKLCVKNTRYYADRAKRPKMTTMLSTREFAAFVRQQKAAGRVAATTGGKDPS